MLPNFIIPGAPKSGTTALQIYLSQHPDIYMVNQEIHFFDNDDNFKKGIEWYKRFFKEKKKMMGEKTPQYMYDKKVPARIHKYLGEVKLVFLLRNPIDRAYSHYWHNKRIGKEPLSFEKAIKTEEKRMKVDTKNSYLYSYKDRGQYIDQIMRYNDFFPKSKMKFVLSEELNENTREVLKNILQFLEVGSDFEFTDVKKKHVGGVPRSNSLAKIAGNKFVNNIKYLKWGIKIINTKKIKPPIAGETRRYLQMHFSSYNQQLEKFTGLDLERWGKNS